MKKLIIFIILFTPALTFAEEENVGNPKCIPPKTLEDLTPQAEFQLQHLKEVELPKEIARCPSVPVPIFTELTKDISDIEYSPRFKRFYLLSQKLRTIDKYFAAFPDEFPAALNKYLDVLPRIDEFRRKTSMQDHEACFSDEFEQKTEAVFAFHEDMLINILPAAIQPLRTSKSVVFNSASAKELAEKLYLELNLQNQRICKDEEIQRKDKIIPPLLKNSRELLEKQDTADVRSENYSVQYGHADEPLPLPLKISQEFKKAFARSHKTINTDDFYPFYYLIEDLLPLPKFYLQRERFWEKFKATKFLSDPIKWLMAGIKVKETAGETRTIEEWTQARPHERHFETRHQKWRNDRNYLIDRAKHISGIRTDGFAKKLEYTFQTILEINAQLEETLLYKDIVCARQANLVSCKE